MPSPFAKIPSVNELLDNLSDQTNYIDAKYLKILIDDTISDIKSNPKKFSLDKKARSHISEDIQTNVRKRVSQLTSSPLKKVINATGVVLHTGLGRAPLGQQAIESIHTLSAFTNLEIDLDSGRRGQRLDHISPLLRLLTGSDDAVVVNNNAAAVLLMLHTVSRRKEVIVSRGELVEIGGSFRMPEVMKTSGTKMVEVGATNKTHLRDYENVINDKTAAIMLVHPSNYEILGFTAKPEIKDIIELAHKNSIPVLYDVGSGALIDMQKFGFEYEPVIEDMVKLGIDLISFSGDKLLGGPQAGIIVGKSEWIKKIKRNHLLRALRCDKITLGILSNVLKGYLNTQQVINNNMTLNLFYRDINHQKKLVKDLIALENKKDHITLKMVAVTGKVGSGAYPLAKIPAMALRITSSKISADKIARKLRLNETPIFGYIENDEYFLNMLTVFPDELSTIAEAVNKL
jgi:L-seryl-tRNA(Ser) seleniumtransferase